MLKLALFQSMLFPSSPGKQIQFDFFHIHRFHFFPSLLQMRQVGDGVELSSKVSDPLKLISWYPGEPAAPERRISCSYDIVFFGIIFLFLITYTFYLQISYAFCRRVSQSYNVIFIILKTLPILL
ncbi:hypothetical protein EO93_06145 [Methanosarcina sp. 1.H.A.2.2]|nr:hypothetical protein EO93_06145 [Methanosarcina sp. 1.H.A.2.2]